MSINEMAQAMNNKTYGCVLSAGCPCDCGDDFPESCVETIVRWLESKYQD